MKNKAPLQNSIKQNKLTKREIEVIQLIARGDTSKIIAEKLKISYTTVGTHRRNILKKLALKNASHLTHFAFITGIVNEDNF